MRKVYAQLHSDRPAAKAAYLELRMGLQKQGVVLVDHIDSEVELVMAVGGDGTVLSAAPLAREAGLPLFGINLGHMGFLTEAEKEDLKVVIDHIVRADFEVENRMSMQIAVRRPGAKNVTDWALNEAAILHTDAAHPAHFGLGIDGQGVSTYGADGIIVATPTGSTAYSFSAGGPVVWPDVQALVVTPLAAHGLFTRPLVVSPTSIVEVAISPLQRSRLELWADGQRCTPLEPGTTVQMTRSEKPVRFARINAAPFSSRLVRKFDLPVHGWRDS
ncbi:MAG: NAD kinase [Winkia neuii]|uniref:NAD kinase n=1 Tax=Winkia neuii TaxID=33007 RepID=A0A2I1IKT1_9ACTO|nr:NAD kinase [Winkia neuii]OFJ71188.1 ATP-NAD kinase [Actinomyces sp. HMSC064C12]OFK03798.1 ATP-NAD kinase [Actinomyces sp. HMSC072A03]OFT56020.1 ATP-NAD kinase [Actinomyces sp. HMSC06A08]KWZ72713.1 putative inorganic polyphosphate/ATP-NAD kinase [Winkia neuii]MDK8100271.1 NAD kinase [Winkia neuii]